MNRLTRDQILHRALDMIDSPNLNDKERPGGILQANAMSILWIQDAIDYFHHRFPTATDLQSAILTAVVGSPTAFAVPEDYLIDVRDGVVLYRSAFRDIRRLRRLGQQELLDRQVAVLGGSLSGTPTAYGIVGHLAAPAPGTLILDRAPEAGWTVQLSYYALPAALTATSVPRFPDTWALMEFVRLRGLEWIHEAEPGAALKYAGLVVADLQKQGIGVEETNDQIPASPQFFRPTGAEPYTSSGWLGDTVPRT